VQEAAHIVVGDHQAEPLGFKQLDVLLDEPLSDTLHHEGEHKLGKLLALEHARGKLLDVGGRNLVNRGKETAERSATADDRVGVRRSSLVIEDAGHQGDDHGDACDRDDDDEDALHKPAVFLKETNHGWVTTFAIENSQTEPEAVREGFSWFQQEALTV